MITRMDMDGMHVYYDGGGRCYPSATAVISELWPYRGPPNDGSAARLGSAVHEAMAEQLRGREYDPGRYGEACCDRDEMHRHVIRLLPHADRLTGVEAVEEPMVSPGLGIGGTVDAVARLDGRLAVIDWKTKSAEPGEEAIGMHHLQAAMYAYMWSERTGAMPLDTAVISSWSGGPDGPGTLAHVREVAATLPTLFGEEVMAAVGRVRGRLGA